MKKWSVECLQAFFMLLLLTFSGLSLANDCSKLLVKIDPVTGEFQIRRSSLEFQSWRNKASPHTPDSAFAYEVLNEQDLENAHGIQSRYRTQKSLSELETAEVIHSIDSHG